MQSMTFTPRSRAPGLVAAHHPPDASRATPHGAEPARRAWHERETPSRTRTWAIGIHPDRVNLGAQAHTSPRMVRRVIRVILADDNVIVREGLREILPATPASTSSPRAATSASYSRVWAAQQPMSSSPTSGCLRPIPTRASCGFRAAEDAPERGVWCSASTPNRPTSSPARVWFGRGAYLLKDHVHDRQQLASTVRRWPRVAR